MLKIEGKSVMPKGPLFGTTPYLTIIIYIFSNC